MSTKWLLVVSAVAVLCGQGAKGYTFSDVDSLTTGLFSTYKKNIRPFVDSSSPTFVYIGIWLASIEDLDAVKQELEFTAFLYMDWIDLALQWDPTSHNGTTYFTYPQQELWIPDVTITNSVVEIKELGYDRNYMYVQSTGYVQWLPGGIYRTSCDIDVTYFPFDHQTCQVVFSTLVSTSAEIDLDADPTHSVSLELYSDSGTWDLEKITVKNGANRSGKTQVIFTIEIKRLRTFYVVSLIIPVLFLALTATLVFALPVGSGEKMGTAITVLLAYAVYLTIISDQMPQTSTSVSILAIYLNIVLGQTSLGVVLSVWILNLHFRDDDLDPPSKQFCRVTAFLRRLLCKNRNNAVGKVPTSSPASTNRDKATLATRMYREATNEFQPRLNTPDTASMDGVQNHSNASSPSKLAFKVPVPSVGENTPSCSDYETFTWRKIALTIDRFLFWSFSGFLLLTTFIFFATLLIGN